MFDSCDLDGDDVLQFNCGRKFDHLLRPKMDFYSGKTPLKYYKTPSLKHTHLNKGLSINAVTDSVGWDLVLCDYAHKGDEGEGK